METINEYIFSVTSRLVDGARKRALVVRLLGGTAIRMRCPTAAAHRSLARVVPDIDLITRKKDGRSLSELLVELGFEPVKMFNALHGDRRMLFMDKGKERQVDVFLGIFEMCHTFDFSKRMAVDEVTLPLADLLLTKLQIIEINEKDYKDIVCLVLDHPLSETDGDKERINAAYIADLCANDWGIYRTITRNLGWAKDFVQKMDWEPANRDLALQRLTTLIEMIEKEPKSMRWKVRAKVGDRVIWYDAPEKVGRISLDQPPT